MTVSLWLLGLLSIPVVLASAGVKTVSLDDVTLRAQAIAELGRVSRRWVLTTYYDAQSFPVWRDRVRQRPRTLTSCTRAAFDAEARAAGLRVVARRYRRRWFSQQVIVLLERAASPE